MPADTLLTSRDCSSSFAFTRSEQRLYASLGFNRPARCEACRATRKVERSRTSGSAPTAGAGAGSSGYEEARTEQAFVEGRIQEIETLLAIAQCIAEAQESELVRLGSRVTLVGLDADDSAETYRIVGSHEADPRRGLVSDASPIGAAVLGCGVGDEVTVQAPDGSFHLRIVGIS